MPSPTRKTIPPRRIPRIDSRRTDETSVSGGIAASGVWVSWVTLVLLPRRVVVGLLGLLLQPLGHRFFRLGRQLVVRHALAHLERPDVRRDPPPVLRLHLRRVPGHRPVPPGNHLEDVPD